MIEAGQGKRKKRKKKDANARGKLQSFRQTFPAPAGCVPVGAVILERAGSNPQDDGSSQTRLSIPDLLYFGRDVSPDYIISILERLGGRRWCARCPQVTEAQR